MSLFETQNAEEFAALLDVSVHAPYVRTGVSRLGGHENVSILLTVGLEPQEMWPQGYIENSRYVKLHVQRNGSITFISDSGVTSSHRAVLKKRWRKTVVKSWGEAIDKINRYVTEAA